MTSPLNLSNKLVFSHFLRPENILSVFKDLRERKAEQWRRGFLLSFRMTWMGCIFIYLFFLLILQFMNRVCFLSVSYVKVTSTKSCFVLLLWVITAYNESNPNTCNSGHEIAVFMFLATGYEKCGTTACGWMGLQPSLLFMPYLSASFPSPLPLSVYLPFISWMQKLHKQFWYLLNCIQILCRWILPSFALI